MTDFRALCAEMVEKLDELNCNFNIPNQSALIERANAALAQPEPQGPTDEELQELASGFFTPTEFHFVDFARAALARWGRPAIEPVPVVERLPGAEDCDAEGKCWVVLQPGIWALMKAMPPASHWLPHHALPMPQQEANND